MAVLAAATYDPASAVSKSCASRLAMTAFDTTNLRKTFTAPANGIVLVRIRCTELGASTFPSILLGVMEASTVKGRVSPIGALSGVAGSDTRVTQEALFLVPGLTPGNSYTWDAAYGVEILLASTNIKYGGPNDASGADAWGALCFDITDAPSCLGAILYDPGTAGSASTASLLAMTAIDTTNLRITFTAPASGRVLCRMMGCNHGSGSGTFPQILWGVMSGATVMCRVAPIGGLKETALATARLTLEGEFYVSDLTPGNSYSFDLAYGVQKAVASSAMKWGGPNDTTTDNAFGAIGYAIFAA